MRNNNSKVQGNVLILMYVLYFNFFLMSLSIVTFRYSIQWETTPIGKF